MRVFAQSSREGRPAIHKIESESRGAYSFDARTSLHCFKFVAAADQVFENGPQREQHRDAD